MQVLQNESPCPQSRSSEARKNNKTHKKKSEPFSSLKMTKMDQFLTVKPPSNDVMRAELRMAALVAETMSINAVDKLSETVKATFTDSNVASKMRLHRTKCTALINQVLAPSMSDDLREDLGDSYFSLIIDESTDVSTKKLLCLVIRYFSKNLKRIVSTYLGLIEVESTTTLSLTKAIEDFLRSSKLDLQKLVGIGTDGASVMCGKNHSVFTMLKEKLPGLILVKCVCHSLHLCCSKACEQLPRSLDFLVGESYRWFSSSSKRQLEYQQLFQALNDGSVPLKLLRPVETRWLSLYPAVLRILNQWEELTLHFQLSAEKERCYTADVLANMFRDRQNKAYLLFLKGVLQHFQKTNLLFQSESLNVYRKFRDLKNFCEEMLGRIVTPSFLEKIKTAKKLCSPEEMVRNLMHVGACHYGYEFAVFMQDFTREQAQSVKERCKLFLIEACKQILMRIPSKMHVLCSLADILPDKVLKQVKPNLHEVPALTHFLPANDISVSKVETQWRMISVVDWKREDRTIVFEDPVNFWSSVQCYKDASDDHAFSELAGISLGLLSLPVSNADVERVFSKANNLKTDLRNRLSTDVLSSLLHVHYFLKRRDSDVSSFEPLQI